MEQLSNSEPGLLLLTVSGDTLQLQEALSKYGHVLGDYDQSDHGEVSHIVVKGSPKRIANLYQLLEAWKEICQRR